jgi:hypothetical protein
VQLCERPVGPLSILTPLLRPTLRARNDASLSRLCDLVSAKTAS